MRELSSNIEEDGALWGANWSVMADLPHSRSLVLPPPAPRRPAGRVRAFPGLRRKNWDAHVGDLAEMADSPGFQALRDEIIAAAQPQADDRVLDVGAGTGLLTLALASAVEGVWALDVSDSMCDYLKAESARLGLEHVDVIRANATSVPLPSASVDLVVSNYCFHHLRDSDKDLALAELRRVLRPGGRLVFADMMFRVGIVDRRNRAVVGSLIRRLLRRGPAGILRIAKNAFRYLTGRWEQPAEVEWWQGALERAGFTNITVQALEHEGGIAFARCPADLPVAVAA
jgi:ubiquinone/menaquinone biosynthesis C-methylase UbiE